MVGAGSKREEVAEAQELRPVVAVVAEQMVAVRTPRAASGAGVCALSRMCLDVALPKYL